MSKQNLFLDIDNSITNSTKAFVDTYNHLYKYHEEFIPAQWDKVQKYDFSDQCGILKTSSDRLEIFNNSIFFKKLEFINHNTYGVIRELSNKYRILFISIGTPKNLSLKSLWLEENFPFINDYILINNGNKIDKSIVNMNEAIFIDDCTGNLDSSNAKLKIIFGREYEWSQTKDHQRCFNWTEVAEKLL